MNAPCASASANTAGLRRHWLGLCIVLLLGSLSPSARAADAQWTGTTDGLWSNSANWGGISPVPGTGNTATFSSGNGGHSTISLGTGVTINGVTFDTVDAPYIIGAGAVNSETLTLNNGGSVLIDATPTQSDELFNCAIVLGTNANTAGYLLGNDEAGKTLTLAGTITGGTGGTAGTKTVQFGTGLSGAGNIVISGNIGGGGGTLAVNTLGGSVTFSGANTFTGALEVSFGALVVPAVNNASAAGPLGNSASAVILGEGYLEYTGATATSTKKFALNGYGGFQIDSASTVLTLSGIMSGTGADLDKSGPGTLTLTAANTRTGLVYVYGGTLKLSGAGALGAAGQSVYIDSSATLDLGGTSQSVGVLDGGGTIVNNSGSGTSTLTFQSLDEFAVFSGTIADNNNSTSGIVAVTLSGTGTHFLGGTNTYTGATSVLAGALQILSNGALGSAATGTTVSSGATLYLGGVNGGSTVPLNISAEPLTISGVGAGSANGFDGALESDMDGNIYGGLIKLGAAATIASDSGTFNITNTGIITGATFTLTLAGAGNGSIASIIGTTTGGVIISSPGTWTLTGANTFTGALTVTGGGTLVVPTVNNASTVGPLGDSATAITLNGTLEYTGATATSTKKFTLSSLGAFQIDSASTELTLSGVLAGTGTTLAKYGSGILTLTAANTRTGDLYVDGGTLKLSGVGALGAAGGYVYVLNGCTLDLGGTSQTLGTLDGGGTIVNNSGSGTSTLTLKSSGTSADFIGTIADNNNSTGGVVAVTVNGTGANTIGGANTYTGATSVLTGELVIQSNTALGSATTGTTVSSGATLYLGGVLVPLTTPLNISSEPLTISGVGAGGVSGFDGALESGLDGNIYGGLIKLGAAATIASDSGMFSITNTGTITGAGFGLTLTGAGDGILNSIIGTTSGTLTMTGGGTWTLTGANTYTGLTTISSGILNIQNAGALGGTTNGTTITSGATLQIQGGITVGAEALTIRGTGAGTGALENVSDTNTYGGLVTLGAASTISSDTGTLNLTNTGTITGATFGLTLTGAGNGSIASIIGTTTGTLTQNGPGTWTLTGLSTYTGKTFVKSGTVEITTLKSVSGGASSLGAPTTAANGTIDLGSTTTGGTLRFIGTADASSNRVINLAGTTGGATLDSSSATNNKIQFTSAFTATGAGSKTLTLTGSSTGGNEISAAIVDNSATNKTSVAKTGAGTWILSGTNTYTGNTSVSAGTLTLTTAVLANAANVSLTTGAALNLTFAGSDTVSQLLINGVVQSAGTWGGLTSSASFKTALITGSGTLTVTSGAAQQPYTSWVASFALSSPNDSFNADPDHDGIANGLEWILGGSPLVNSTSILPQVGGNTSNLTLTFTRNDASESTSTLFAEWSTNLTTWNDVPVGPASSGPDANGVTITVTENGAAPDTVVVTIPRSNGPQGRLFTRLKATMP